MGVYLRSNDPRPTLECLSRKLEECAGFGYVFFRVPFAVMDFSMMAHCKNGNENEPSRSRDAFFFKAFVAKR